MANVMPNPLYPRKDSLEEAEQYLRTQLPITSPNELTATLAIYRNTLLRLVQQRATHEECHCTP
ncbi:hypothetical protein [uncultured Marinobacter sp.]|uniref:hypothetical protein n=1 Tax=uncultured Marinobacter sp. TaxID=187379 RepID=UPI00259A8815|nr:hypothetical protein [uncultured Marinobacter sp.]